MNIKKAMRVAVPVVATFTIIGASWGVFNYSDGMYKESYSSLQQYGDRKIEMPYNASQDNYKIVPYEIKKDADSLVARLNDGKDATHTDYESVLKLLSAVEGKDIVMFITSGGLGKTPLDKQKGWNTVIEGTKSVLNDMGYNTLIVEYRRTEPNLQQFIGELITGFESGAEDLSFTINFLQKYYPNLKFVMESESFGAMLNNTAMKFFVDNQNVYSIQAGILEIPKLSENYAPNNTLRINDNGIEPDSLNDMNIPYIVFNNLKNLNEILQDWKKIEVPGHRYSWDLKEVRNEITSYLNNVFGQLN
ncbi:MAG: hypothetical protein V1831_02915 [Candidatus Woesearchaeota archaeon]